MGYTCSQKIVKVETIDEQVLEVLWHLKPPATWRETIASSIGELLGEKALEERLAEIHATIKRMDIRWDNGFITDEEEFIRQRVQLQHELEKLTPVDNDDLEQAVDLLQNFPSHWNMCNDSNAKRELIRRVVERVYVQGEEVVALTLHSNCHLVLEHKINEPTEYSVDPFLSDNSCPVRERRDLNPRPSA